jgi:hypothetical protein
MYSDTLLIISLISLVIAILLIIWIYNINSNTKKLKKIMFGILYLKVKELKDKGEEINIQSIYEKGELL